MARRQTQAQLSRIVDEDFRWMWAVRRRWDSKDVQLAVKRVTKINIWSFMKFIRFGCYDAQFDLWCVHYGPRNVTEVFPLLNDNSQRPQNVRDVFRKHFESLKTVRGWHIVAVVVMWKLNTKEMGTIFFGTKEKPYLELDIETAITDT